LLSSHATTPLGARAAATLATRAPHHEALRAAQPWLIQQLSGPHEQATWAIQALAAFATPEAVQPLLPLTTGLSTPSALKQLAREAIASIQARAGGERGALSLAQDGTSGGLELADRSSS
jgi:hypothetical protein